MNQKLGSWFKWCRQESKCFEESFSLWKDCEIKYTTLAASLKKEKE
jgi:hypothetical protein